VVTGNFYRFGPNYDQTIKPYPYDPQEAMRLLDEAGWIDHDGDGIRDKDGVPFSFIYIVPAGSRAGQNIGLILRENLLRAGIEMEVRSLEWAAMLKFITSREFDAVMLAWSTSIDEDPYQLWHSSQTAEGSNFIGFQNAEADRLIEAGRVEFDPKKRSVIYKKLHRLIHEEEPYTFLFISPSLVAVAKRFIDVKQYKLGLDITEWGVKPWDTLMEW
jgi:peptide/nickel transport system substrate-binding protein